MKMEELLLDAQDNFLKKIEESNDEVLDQSGGKCSWWNLSCRLGNNGDICTMSHECAAGCNL